MTNPSPAAQRIAVIGAGLVGSACALALAAEGHRVTILDPDPPGAGTSSGNAGGIVTGAVVPTATPQVLRALPGYVLDRNGPAVLRLRHAPRALPWLWRFIRAGRPSEVARIAAALQPLVQGSLHAHRHLAALAGAGGLITDQGWLKVFASDAEFAATAPDRALMDRAGVRYQVLDRDEVLSLEPGLNPGLARIGLHQPESGFVRNPRGLAQAYADAALSRGARHLRLRVRGLSRRADGVTLQTEAGPQDFARVVIAAGAWSASLARQALGLLACHIRTACADGGDVEARSGMLLGSMLAGMAFANAPVAAIRSPTVSGSSNHSSSQPRISRPAQACSTKRLIRSALARSGRPRELPSR